MKKCEQCGFYEWYSVTHYAKHFPLFSFEALNLMVLYSQGISHQVFSWGAQIFVWLVGLWVCVCVCDGGRERDRVSVRSITVQVSEWFVGKYLEMNYKWSQQNKKDIISFIQQKKLNFWINFKYIFYSFPKI